MLTSLIRNSSGDIHALGYAVPQRAQTEPFDQHYKGVAGVIASRGEVPYSLPRANRPTTPTI